MPTPHSMDALFLTNFSDYCYRSIPAVAQLADSLLTRLTILHAYDPRKSSRDEAERHVHSFYPEADRYTHCRRVAIPGPVSEAVHQHLQSSPAHLLMAPPSDPIRLPRLGDRSLRASLIENCGIPVWTMGPQVKSAKLMQPARNIACWLDFYTAGTEHLAFALDYANKVHGTLHVMRALPEMSEGALGPMGLEGKALHPDPAAEEIVNLCANAGIRPQVHVAVGPGRAVLRRMLRECDADVVFLRNEESVVAKWLGLRSRMGEGLPCPAIYVGKFLKVRGWNLQSGAALRSTRGGTGAWVADLGLV